MNRRNITPTIEDYLRAIYFLQEKHGENTGVIALADYLDLAKSTVSERLKDLDAQGFISYKKYSSIAFTKKGALRARTLTFKHRVVEVFLHNILKLPKNKIHREAHKLEHAFSATTIRRLYTFLGNPKKDPHGKSIPR